MPGRFLVDFGRKASKLKLSLVKKGRGKMSKIRRKIPTAEMRKIKEEGIPVVRCQVEGPNLVFWCPYCGDEHRHGSTGTKAFVVEHRVAHCRGERGFHPKGYYVFAETDGPPRRRLD